MKLKLSDIVNSINVIEELSSYKMDIDKSMILKKFVIRAREENKIFEKIKLELIKQYGKENPEKKGEFIIEEDAPERAEFLEKWQELFNKEIDIDYEKITLEKKGLKLSVNDLIALENFINWG